MVGYLMPNPLCTYILNIKNFFVWVLWHINHCRLSNTKSFLYIYIWYIGFFVRVLWHIIYCRSFNVKSFLYLYAKYVINNFKEAWALFVHSVKGFPLFLFNTNTQLNVKTVLFQTIQFCMSTKLNGSKYCYISLIIIIIIMSCRYHRYPWPSLATSLYYSSPLAGLQGYIPYPHIAAVCMFELVVLLLLGHMRGSKGVHHW